MKSRVFAVIRRKNPLFLWEDVMFNKKTVRDIDVKGKKVLVRVDFNVPF